MNRALALITIVASLLGPNVHAASAGKSLFAYTARSEVKTIDGRWILTKRECGMPGTVPWKMSPAEDAYLNGRDAMKLEVNDDVGRLTIRIDGVKTKINLLVDQTEHRIRSLLPNQKMIYRFETADRITILTTDFGPGSTCPEGAVLFTDLERY